MGLGGIAVGNPITLYVAQNIVKANLGSSNVFSVYYNDACALANSVFTGAFTTPEAHRDNNKPLNHQHIHAITKPGGIRGKCHIFFAIPYMV